MTQEPTAKVLFRIQEEDGSSSVETLWAVPLGGDRYKLDNSPFYAYGVSWQDTVLAPFDPAEHLPTFQAVLERSGNRTIRIMLNPPLETGNASDELLKGLIDLGCSYEGASPVYASINVPPEADLQEVRGYLIDHNSTWEHADPTYDTLFPDG
ncbi:MAG: DUF4265 domain-containing protein [Lysobacteraceae bacterium]